MGAGPLKRLSLLPQKKEARRPVPELAGLSSQGCGRFYQPPADDSLSRAKGKGPVEGGEKTTFHASIILAKNYI
jgi:hypothetical protein